MRLDHLLSREKCEGEEPEHDPRSRVERVERFSELQEETPEGRPARRRAEEKDASDESTVLEVFLHCIALKVCQAMAKLQAFCPAKERRRPHLENCTAKESKQTLRRIAVRRLRGLRRAPSGDRSSEQERRVDAKALIADEGRGKLRKAMGSRKQA